jgi:Cytochrome C oxidase, cbb3-type, subunit III
MKCSTYIKPVLETVILLFVTQMIFAADETSRQFETEYYRVENGKIDPDTFLGYNIYHHVCVGCHGVGGVGTDLTPNLTKSLAHLSPAQFEIKVLHKFAIKFSTDDWMNMEQAMFEEIIKRKQQEQGEMMDMPRWEHNPIVSRNVEKIYRYLKARSDGVIGVDKPGLLKD